MKRMIKILLSSLLLVLLVTGCKDDSISIEKQKADSEGVKHCTRVGDLSGGTATMSYDIYYKGKYVTVLHSIETVVSTNNSILDSYEKAYKSVFKAYEGIEHYTNKITRTSNSVTSETTINYAEIDTKKLITIEGREDNIFNDEDKVELEDWLTFAKKYGANCEE